MEIIKSIAIGSDVQEYIDLTTDPSILEKPKVPIDNASTIRVILYRESAAIYYKKRKALRAIRTHIQELISRIYLNLTFKYETLRDMLIKLKQRIVLSDKAREIELRT